jgi:hypothetical protein
MGEWKLIFDMMGYGQLYHLISDPCELNNLFGHPNSAEQRNALMAEMLTWSIREQHWLPTGPQGPKWQTKWIGEHNWCASHRHGVAPESYIRKLDTKSWFASITEVLSQPGA